MKQYRHEEEVEFSSFEKYLYHQSVTESSFLSGIKTEKANNTVHKAD